MRVVAALGGNALLRRGEAMDAATQRANARRAAEALAPLILQHEVIITHGNGPQIGLLALQSASDETVAPYPLDVLGAESEGMIGYLLEQELRNVLPTSRIATLLSLAMVREDDPAFAAPTKFVGHQYVEAEARRLAVQHGWQVAQDGAGWRRVVASPAPKSLLGIDAVRTLVDAQFVVICMGGGGIPVARSATGLLVGAEAVIDKDRASALLADQLQADCLLMLTDVPGVFLDWGTADACLVLEVRPEQLADYSFPAGSMGPKVESAIHFARGGKRQAFIGALEDASMILKGMAGTTVSSAAGDLTCRRIPDGNVAVLTSDSLVSRSDDQ